MDSNLSELGPERRWIAGVTILVGLASVAALIVGRTVGVPVLRIYWDYVRVIVRMAPWALMLLAVPLTAGAALRGVRSPFAQCRSFLGERLGTRNALLGTLAPIVLMPLLMAAYGTLKQLQPLVAPFRWDGTFAEMGEFMMFGYRPWQIAFAVFGSPFDLEVLNFLYAMWLPLLFIAVLSFSFLAPPYLRARFFVTFAASWLLLGVVAAFLLSSAGPCYAALVHAPDAAGFAPLMAKLHAMSANGYGIGSLSWQRELWQAEASHHYGFGLGISAMPSMHNAIACIYVLCASRARWWFRISSILFAAAILVGSVVLGWHYLADGLVAWIGVAAIWWAAGVYLRWCGYARTPTPMPVSEQPLIERAEWRLAA